MAAALLMTLFIIVGAACNNKPSATDSGKPFKVAFNTWIGYSPLLLAKEKGFLKEEGLDVDISILEGVGEKNSALIRGDVDAVGHTADSAVVSAASGVDGQIIFVFDRSLGSDGILTKKSVNSMLDLKGRKVALEPGFTGHFFFLALLNEAGMQPSDVQIVPMETGTAGSTFVSGNVDAAVTWQPWLGRASGVPDGKVFITSKDRPGLIIDVLYMNRSVIESRKDDVIKLIRAMGKATDWYASHKDEGDAIMAKFWKLSDEEQKETVAGMGFMTLQENAAFFGTADNPGQLFQTTKMAAELWRRTDVIKKDVDPKSLIAFDTLNAAAKK
ncbi:MAG TPA: ABC transporter substrate-binding protein [Blastocatellia bacterium]|jgi:NitT/TauT family transport system substrate-binding protein